MLDKLISAGANLVGGLIGMENMDDERERQNNIYWQNVKREENARQTAVQTRVADARAAGIHPLYAMGASLPTFSPVSVGGVSGNPMGNAIAAAGQDISRAVNATAPADIRADAYTKTLQDLSVTNMTLKNELLSSQIRKINAAGTPPAPPIPEYPNALPPIAEDKKQDERPPLQIGGARIGTDPVTSNQEAFEKRYGDDGPVSWATQAAIAWRDLNYNMSSMSFLDILRAIDRKTAIGFSLRDLGIGYQPKKR